MTKQKNIFIALLFAATCFLPSCFNLTEEYTIKEDGSGQFTVNIDMSKMLDMMESFSKFDSSSSTKKKKDDLSDKDTTIYFSKAIDEAKDLSADEKRLFREGSLKVTMKKAEKKFSMDISFPYKTQADLVRLHDSYPTALQHIDFKEAMGSDSSKGKMMDKPSDLTMAGQYLELSAGNNFLQRKVNKEKMKEYNDKDSTMKMMLPMLGSVYISSVIHLPRPASKVDNPYAQLSEDKKTITFKFPIADYIERPEVMNFRVEY